MTDHPTAPVQDDDAELRHNLALIGLEYSAKGLEHQAATISKALSRLSPTQTGLVEALEPILRYHETGGHEGDGSDEALARARAALSNWSNHARP